ncbi:PTS sugar transporter subunit IIA [Alicyclobacillus acidoterrestris]|uniref:PTS sugar transporter subunit IIA n=1 Tax=Alicyclobacillus acidoterrestris (strain ATCC 49025 / DSM 3922 / CIP 106132 / NCIMB 13137 / GD3B) TaxID=1356854 RepID=T0D1J5_ALIAG|nr:PTS sugar transporter subunit IIA [Alicyclobacillus acidoterrestris]EPZ45412.1 hypothetical protein N007_09060 [Alicyclobacillus acidoterrestris ATCC 49025]UNO48440.1 PTS sugar transporter subunit IIA [Alicyclobacillus acidoterrestris]
MVSVILVSHGALASGMLDASQMIVGTQAQLSAISLAHDSNLETLQEAIEAAVTSMDDGDGVLVLADLLGGSPANTSARLLSDSIALVTGLNLPMLLEVLVNRANQSLSDLARVAVESGRAGVMDIRDLL